MPWDPNRYRKFSNERFQPFEDLIQLIHVRSRLRAIDLGCGTGELTERLADMLPESDVLGVDTSREMLDKAQPRARPGLRFEVGAIEEVGASWDLVFSNAALHWVDDHAALVPRLLSLLRSDGQLVVQVPSNAAHPANALVAEIARQEPFAEALHGWTRQWPVLSIAAYAELLYDCGATNLTVYEKVYPHLLENADAIADWTSGTTMVPYFERLPADLHDAFMDQYRAELRALWPGGPVFFGFRRTLFAGTMV